MQCKILLFIFVVLVVGCHKKSTSESNIDYDKPDTYHFISDLEGWAGIGQDVVTDDQRDGDGKVVLEPVAYYGKVDRNIKQFDAELADFDPQPIEALVLHQPIKEIARLMDVGALTSEQLTKFYLTRIAKYDIDKLNSVLELNPDAIMMARIADLRRALGSSHPDLLGIPVLIKANIATDDRMHTTGGMNALLDWDPSQDAHIVKLLRDSGAVILGKANLSENANFFTTEDPNGFTNLGGQTRNAYGFYTVLGSSSGSAVVTAAEFSAIAIGTETQGSINAPSEKSSIVGMKPSIGLVSRHNIIPLAESQDSAGPMARTVEGAAIMLNALASADPADPLYDEVKDYVIPDYTTALVPSYYQSLSVGILDGDEVYKNDVIAVLDTAGVSYKIISTEIAVPGLPTVDIACEFKYQFAAFAEKENLPVKSVQQLIDYNADYPERRAVWGQTDLVTSANSTTSKETCVSNMQTKRQLWQQAVTDFFVAQDIDVLISSYSLSNIYAPAGAPSVSIPFGYTNTAESIFWPLGVVPEGSPISIHTLAPRFKDMDVLAIAKVIELGRENIEHRKHKHPDLDATIQMNEEAGAFSVHDDQRAQSPTYIAE